MADTPHMIDVRGLTKRFPGITAVDRLNFHVESGEIFGLVGPDGAGKTTTLRMLAGVLPPDEGTAHVAGWDVVRDPEEAKNHLSYMAQRFGLYEDLTVEENLRFYADLFGVPAAEREARADQLLAASGIREFRDRLAGNLSGGMKQKLGLSCALIHTPRVVLLDEPTTGVDPVSRRDFWGILYALVAGGVTILISTAYLDEAERCHRVALMHQGRHLLCDTPARLRARLPRGGMVSVRTPAPRRVRQALENAEGVAATLLVGDRVHVTTDDGERRIPALRARLAAAGVPFEEMGVATPSLEDLFVAAVQGKIGAESA